MLDGTGMCGACRVTVDGQTVFACVDGPEFDGHGVDFEGLQQRLKAYVEMERRSDKLYQEELARLKKDCRTIATTKTRA